MRAIIVFILVMVGLVGCALSTKNSSSNNQNQNAPVLTQTGNQNQTPAECLAALPQTACPLVCLPGGEICTVVVPTATASKTFTGTGCNSCLATVDLNTSACNGGVTVTEINGFQSQIICDPGPSNFSH